jgi:type III secretion protein O
MSIFVELLSIKKFREGQAQVVVQKAEGEVVRARREHDQQQSALEAFRAQARRQEAQWYAELCSGPVKLRAINDVRENVSYLRADERRKEETTGQAERALEGATQRSKAARVDLRRATAVKDKFVELATNVAEEAARELQRKEDAEMEEASSVRRERQEWGSGDE